MSADHLFTTDDLDHEDTDVSVEELQALLPRHPGIAKRLARLAAVQLMYQSLMMKTSMRESLQDFLAQGSVLHLDEESDAIEIDGSVVVRIVSNIDGHLTDIENMIKKHSTSKKTFEKMELLVRSILLVATHEITHARHIDAPILIHDYVTVGNSFYPQNMSLINGILDKVAHDVRGDSWNAVTGDPSKVAMNSTAFEV